MNDQTTEPRALRVAMIGHAFMGAVHSHAWRSAHRFFDLPATPVLQVVVGRDAGRSAAAAERFGWAESSTDWRAVVERDDIDLVDMCTPGNTHAEIAVAALAAGKHVLCEKPLANSVAEAEQMTAAAEAAARPGRSRCAASPTAGRRRWRSRRELIAEGRLGTIRHVRAQYLQDWLSDADAPLTWRLDPSTAGSGALGDIGAHVVDSDPVAHRAAHHRGVRPAADLRSRPRPVAGGPAASAVRQRRRRAGPGDRRRRRPVHARFDDGAIGSSRRPGSPWAGRTPSGSRSTDRPARSPSTSRT